MTYGNGHYTRGADGRWRYTLSGDLVRQAVDLKRRDGTVTGLFAPELLPDRLLGPADAAQLVGRTQGAWHKAVCIGHAPAPVGRIGQTPYWTRGVLKAWLQARAAAREPSGKLRAV